MFVRYIAERYPKVMFRICTSWVYAQPFKRLGNVRNLSCLSRAADKICNRITGKKICKQRLEQITSATVHVGGSIFIEPDNFIVPQECFSNPNLFIIGCNFGPYKTETYYDFVLSRLQKARDVCFRDSYSYNTFSSIDHVRLAPDILFGYPKYPTLQSGYGVGISVISLSNRKDLKRSADIYYRAIAQVVDCCARKQIPVKLFSFCKDEGDLKAIEEVMRRSETKTAEICEYDGDVDSMLDEINACECIIASRFHAMIIGWCLCKKVFPVVYSDKQLYVMGDVGFVGPYWDLRETRRYMASELLANVLNSPPITCIEDCKKQSETQFRELDAYLNLTEKG